LAEPDMSLQLDGAVGERLKFGEFQLAPDARALWRRGEQVRLGSRALDILIALASRPGQILSKDDLTKAVWRGAFVDETSLRVGISAQAARIAIQLALSTLPLHAPISSAAFR
jgi:DNA-binding response OmpR family regulator